MSLWRLTSISKMQSKYLVRKCFRCYSIETDSWNYIANIFFPIRCVFQLQVGISPAAFIVLWTRESRDCCQHFSLSRSVAVIYRLSVNYHHHRSGESQLQISCIIYVLSASSANIAGFLRELRQSSIVCMMIPIVQMRTMFAFQSPVALLIDWFLSLIYFRQSHITIPVLVKNSRWKRSKYFSDKFRNEANSTPHPFAVGNIRRSIS